MRMVSLDATLRSTKLITAVLLIWMRCYCQENELMQSCCFYYFYFFDQLKKNFIESEKKGEGVGVRGESPEGGEVPPNYK